MVPTQSTTLSAIRRRGWPALQAAVRGRLQLLDAHAAAQPMIELIGLQQHRHAVVDLGHETHRYGPRMLPKKIPTAPFPFLFVRVMFYASCPLRGRHHEAS